MSNSITDYFRFRLLRRIDYSGDKGRGQTGFNGVEEERLKLVSLHTHNTPGRRGLWFQRVTPEEESVISCVAPDAMLFRFYVSGAEDSIKAEYMSRTLII